jgi:DNA repair exonuclease SbcCD nuclease subunit
MKDLPIFTTSNPALSRWQSFIEEYLIEENPTLSISEIRTLPLSQGCWLFVKMKLEGKKTTVPTADFEDENIAHQAYANEYFFDTIQEYLLTRNIVNFNESIDAWNYSTDKTWDWMRTTGWRWVTSWMCPGGVSNIYRKPKDKNFSVIDWVLPKNSRIALIGDWGTSNDDAKEFLKALINDGVDCIIHLGDVYYSGTTAEYKNNFINIIRNLTNVPVFGIPGNHEYYSQGEGFYYMIDTINQNIPKTNAKQSASYFCLKTEDDSYQFVGLDTGINDGNPVKTYFSPPAPGLKSQDDYAWAIDKIKNFKGKTIMLSHHQLFSHVGGLNSDSYGDSCANPNLYKNFAPYFNKIAAWYWGHEHSFALYNQGAFGLNQGRLIGSSSYEQAISDDPYADNYPLVPFDSKNQQLSPNKGYDDDDDADYYYPHAGALLTLSEDTKPKIEYFRYPSWKNNHAPQNPQLESITEEIISNPTKTPTGIWEYNRKIDSSNFKSDKAPAICLYENIIYTVFTNPDDNNHLWWCKIIYKDSKLQKFKSEKLPSKNYSKQYDKNNDDDTPSSKTNPVLVEFKGTLYLAYTNKDSNHDNETLYWCTYDIANNLWTKMGEILCSGKPQIILLFVLQLLAFKKIYS